MPDVKAVVGAVEVGDGQVVGTDFFGFFIDPFLKSILMFGDDIKRMVNIIESEIVKWLKEKVFVEERISL
jgi:hypothetical protein